MVRLVFMCGMQLRVVPVRMYSHFLQRQESFTNTK
jgi:hypothetical protein